MADSIGARIRAARIDAGMTQAQLGSRCGMSDSTMRKYESGKFCPKIGTLSKIANALNLPVEYFSGEGDEPHFGHWVSIKTRLPEPEKEYDTLVPCFVNVITWDLECSPFYPDESYGEYVSPAMYDTEQKTFSVGWDGCARIINALLDPDNTDGRSGSRVTHWMEYPSTLGCWEGLQ